MSKTMSPIIEITNAVLLVTSLNETVDFRIRLMFLEVRRDMTMVGQEVVRNELHTQMQGLPDGRR
jgi:hypothetical protein